MPSWPTLFPSVLDNKNYSGNNKILDRKTYSKFNQKEADGLFIKKNVVHVSNDDKYRR